MRADQFVGMPKKRKQKALPPRVTRMDRSARLQSARTWLKTYKGKNIAAGYRKHFAVDWVCALTELEILGVRLDSGYKQRLLKSLEGHLAACQRRKAQREESYEASLDQGEHFAYIAGYTSGGLAFGVTWEELEAFDVIDPAVKTNTTGNDEQPEPLPF